MFAAFPGGRPMKEVPSFSNMANLIANPFLDHLHGELQRSP